MACRIGGDQIADTEHATQLPQMPVDTPQGGFATDTVPAAAKLFAQERKQVGAAGLFVTLHQLLHLGGNFNLQGHPCFAAAVADIVAMHVLFPEVEHVYKAHAARIKEE